MRVENMIKDDMRELEQKMSSTMEEYHMLLKRHQSLCEMLNKLTTNDKSDEPVLKTSIKTVPFTNNEMFYVDILIE